MAYAALEARLKSGNTVCLDGGTGTELERRGAAMDPGAWCGPASLDNADLLVQIHADYIAAGADIITANTYASSPIMLEAAGVADQFEAINRTAVECALRAREASGRDDVVVAGSVSHMCPVIPGGWETDKSAARTSAELEEAFGRLATLLAAEGVELLLLEMMYDPERMPSAFSAAIDTGLPVWAGFTARRSDVGDVISHAVPDEIPFADVVTVLNDFDVQAAGIMHSDANVTSDALAIVRERFDGPLLAYPDSGYFAMPNWQFEDIIPPADLHRFAEGWVAQGTQILGGCCGLSPEHIQALAPLKT